MKKLLFTFVLFTTLLTLSAEMVRPSGGGTSDDPFIMESFDNLHWLFENSSYWDNNATFLQINDIQIPAEFYDGLYRDRSIGEQTAPFTGVYDGNNHVISGFTYTDFNDNFVGLFGSVTGSTISNLGVINADIIGSSRVGVLCGHLVNSSVENCYAQGVVVGDWFLDEGHNSSPYYYDGDRIGGLIGSALSSTISSCFADVTVSGADYCGGLIGEVYASTITQSYSASEVSGCSDIGGLLGKCSGNTQVSNCYVNGNVNYIPYLWDYKGGGIVGTSMDSDFSYCYLNVIDEDKYHSRYDIGLFAYSVQSSTTSNLIFNSDQIENRDLSVISWSWTSSDIVYASTNAMKSITTYTDNGWDFQGETANGTEDLWTINSVFNDGFPYLTVLESLVPNAEETNPQLVNKSTLYNAYPNPFNPDTTIKFDVAKNDIATVHIFNVKGQLIKTYPAFAEGEHEVHWLGKDNNQKYCPSGVYFYRLVTKNTSETKKMILMK